jgi:hypothetical protein
MISYANLPAHAEGSKRVSYNGEDLITFSKTVIDLRNKVNAVNDTDI